jgi:hypothetical protein
VTQLGLRLMLSIKEKHFSVQLKPRNTRQGKAKTALFMLKMGLNMRQIFNTPTLKMNFLIILLNFMLHKEK